MPNLNSAAFLRRVLMIDAVVSGATGLLLLVAANPLSSLLALPAALLLGAGIVLLPFAVFVGWTASRPVPPKAAAWAIIIGNALWTADSLLLLLSGWVQPNAWGTAFVIAQAVAVGVLAELQFFGLRRLRMALA